MSILVAVASKHGSTYEIAEAIAGELRVHGIAADLQDVERVANLDGYDAVVLGSGVYAGNWLPAARAFVDHHRRSLAKMPVWAFSSGPLGTTERRPAGEPAGVKALVESAGARDHQIFTGKLDLHDLYFGERLIVRMVHAPAGDFRDWAEIRAWAAAIARDLSAVAAAG